MVHLYYPGFQFLVNHDVHAQNLEASRIFKIVRLTCTVGMRESRLNCDNSFNAYVLDLIKHVLSAEVGLLFLNVLKDCR